MLAIDHFADGSAFLLIEGSEFNPLVSPAGECLFFVRAKKTHEKKARPTCLLFLTSRQKWARLELAIAQTASRLFPIFDCEARAGKTGAKNLHNS